MTAMTIDAAAVISSAIVPAVMISSSALLLLSFGNRATSVMSRQRSLHREMLHEDVHSTLWTTGLGRQVADISFESRLIRAAVVLLMASILFMLACGSCLMLAVAHDWATYAAVVLFSVGMACYAGGVVVMMSDALIMTRPLALESHLATRIVQDMHMRSDADAAAGV